MHNCIIRHHLDLDELPDCGLKWFTATVTVETRLNIVSVTEGGRDDKRNYDIKHHDEPKGSPGIPNAN